MGERFPQEPADEELLAAVRSALRPPQVPEDVLAAARAVYTWRTVDAELAELSYDSAGSSRPGAGVRGRTAALRTLTFRAREVVVEVGVTPDALTGQVVPPVVRAVELHTTGADPVPVDVDELGCFTVHPLPAGRFRLVCTTAGGERIVTDWVGL
ncbi:hypothetical protein [Kineococcus indalonis]|uniref:hypothetical protein n=1 Tax=Kineococcus indalonis TaxID=2696566 RepID=UPI001412173A|nr:hypothetical protein [Kineococcus indalonis]NAZ85032.1 hypothetical protein [Kineococcus indalonis]